MPIASEIIRNQRSRRTDRHGSGHFGARRGNRLHQGLDIEARAGEDVHSPIDGDILREAQPYADDSTLRGLVIRGSGDWEGYEIKMFYVKGHFCGGVTAGAIIGCVQDLTAKYPGITNHVHVEVRLNGKVMSPMEIFGMCF
jgi:hypothetical protein